MKAQMDAELMLALRKLVQAHELKLAAEQHLAASKRQMLNANAAVLNRASHLAELRGDDLPEDGVYLVDGVAVRVYWSDGPRVDVVGPLVGEIARPNAKSAECMVSP